MRALLVSALAVLACAMSVAPAFTLLNPRDYNAFVPNWTPEDQPVCHVITSGAEWSDAVHPAAVMGHNVFGPPGSLFNRHDVLLLARVMPAGDTAHVFQVRRVTPGGGGTMVDYTYTPPAGPATSTTKEYFAIVVAKPISMPVLFRENGRVVCRVIPHH